LLYLVGVVSYLLVLNILVRLPSSLAVGGGEIPGFGEVIPIVDQVSVVVFKYAFIPIFWNRLGDLTMLHVSFLFLLGAALIFVAGSSLRR
jgi:hypothetical protein